MISDGNNLLTKREMGYQSAFLTRKVSGKGVYTWKFRVEQFVTNYNGWDWIIGVWKTNKERKERRAVQSYFTPNGKDDGYGWLGSCCKLTDPLRNGCYFASKDENGVFSERDYGERLSNGDIVEMILDLEKLEIHWAKNGKHYPIAHKNIEDCEYKAAVMLATTNSKIRLMNC